MDDASDRLSDSKVARKGVWGPSAVGPSRAVRPEQQNHTNTLHGSPDIRILAYIIRAHDDRGEEMKRKLTITVDAELLPIAKRYARSRGVSLSSLIEQSLREVAEPRAPSFASRWRGKFKAAERGGARYDALARKYLQ